MLWNLSSKFIFRLKWAIFSVTSSMLRTKDALEEFLEQLTPGNKLQPQWTRATTHLVMTTIALSLKVEFSLICTGVTRCFNMTFPYQVVNCLASGTPIVTPEYFKDFLEAALSKQKLPKTSQYIPQVAESQSESQLRAPGVSFKVNTKRASLFSSLTFVFMTDKELETNDVPIQLGGGSSRLWSQDDDLELLSKPGVVVIHPRKSKSSPMPAEWKRVSSYLANKSLMFSQDTHIYLAIVHCSTENFCNPRRQTPSVLPKQPVPIVEGKVRALESQNITSQESAGPFRKPTPGASLRPTSSNARTLPKGASREAEPDVSTPSTSEALGVTSSVSFLSPDTPASSAESTIISLKSQPTPAALATPTQSSAPTPAKSEAQSQLSLVDDNLAINNVSRKRTREDELVNTRGAKKGRDMLETQSKENQMANRIEDNLGEASRQKTGMKDTEDSSMRSFLGVGVSQRQVMKSVNPQQKTEDIFAVSPISTLATQSKDTMLNSHIRSTAEDDDDIFGFGDQSTGGIKEKKQESSSSTVRPDSRKRNADEEEDDIFGFSPVKKAVPSRPSQRSQLKEPSLASTATSNTDLIHSTLKTFPLTSEKVTPGKKGVIMDTSVIFQGFIGKEDIFSIKPKVEREEGDEDGQLSKSLCKVTLNVSLLRTSQPRPSYVPAPDPELLGRPTPNYKNFKKQLVGRPDSRVRVPLGRYTGTQNTPGVKEWIAQNPDISRAEAEEEARHKQEDGFWDFLNSQEVCM